LVLQGQQLEDNQNVLCFFFTLSDSHNRTVQDHEKQFCELFWLQLKQTHYIIFVSVNIGKVSVKSSDGSAP